MPIENATDRFEPLHDAHAIEQVSFSVQFEQPLNDDGIWTVRELARQFESDLPGVGEIQGIRFSFGQPSPVIFPTAGAPPVQGVVLTKSRPDGIVESELRVERQSISYRTLYYTRWEEVWGKAGSLFRALLPPYVAQVRIVGMNLSYADKFVSKGNARNCRPADMLKRDSKYLAPHIFEQTDFWHSYTGAFIKVDPQTKRLLNVNADFLEDASGGSLRRVVAITTVLTDMMNQPEYAVFEVTPANATDQVAAHMDQLHKFAKIVFGDVISLDMGKRIALGD